MADSGALASFHPLVREWFLGRYGGPTAVQAAAWPRIAAGEHVLALAPTGSGKTLTAFLGAISRLASGELPADCCSVLYVSPLKALGEDMRRNLEEPLAEISALFRSRAESLPDIRVATRTGDTSQTERRRMLKRPPSILVTTPESLCLLLDAPLARPLLAQVRLLILDEVHALAGNKRGSLLACAVGRLVLLAGEFQRLALSATARPPEAVAAFVGGMILERDPGGSAAYRARKVAVVDPPAAKKLELRVEWPGDELAAPPAGPWAGGLNAPRYDAVIPAIASRVAVVRSLIVFTDSRRRAERIAFLLNEVGGEGTAWAHHGSLAKEARRVVEERLKSGELGCVVATASLELGIDVGSIDEVVLAGAPASVSSALQRIGRSGHGVGQASRGTLYPFHGMDLLLAAATARGVAERAVEETRPVSCPLDILAQALLALAAERPRRVDELYDIVRSFPPFVSLSRVLFDATVEMLVGRYAESRIRELEPRASLDRASGILTAKEGARVILYTSGGAIPDRGLYSLRIAGVGTKIGELDEEFVWERRLGESFSFGAQVWRIVEIGDEAMEVAPARGETDFIPFWKGEAFFRSPEISSRLLGLLDRLDKLDVETGAALLESEYSFSREAAAVCARFAASQKAAGGDRPSLPGSDRVVLEVNVDPTHKADSTRLVIHSLRGRAVNEPLAMALAAVWEEESGLPVRTVVDNDSMLLLVPREGAGEGEDPDKVSIAATAARLLRSLAEEGRLEALIRSRLEGTGLFGAEFRQNAGRALLITRGLPGRRTPLWITRLRAKKLFEAVRSYEDFPVVIETWRSCLSDILDLSGARELVRSIASGAVELSAFASRAPSPFARQTVWMETGEFIYQGDELQTRSTSSISDRVVQEALRSSRLRPRLDAALVADFVARLKRLVPGWAPDDGPGLAEWAKERVLIPVSELGAIVESAGSALAAAIGADPGCDGRLRRITLPGATEEILVHAEREKALRSDPGAFVAEWLRREGPVAPARIGALFGLAPEKLDPLLEELAEEGTIVLDALIKDSEEITAIDAQNLEILLRRSRIAARPRVETRPAADLVRLVAAVQALAPAAGVAASGLLRGADRSRLARVLDILAGAGAPAALWESEIIPARVPLYVPGDLDALLSSEPWQWFGAGRETVALARAENLELFLTDDRGATRTASRLIPPGSETLDFWSIRERGGGSARETALALWSEAWRGLVAADSFAPLREGLVNDFGRALADVASLATAAGVSGTGPLGGRGRRIPRALRERWRAGAPLSGRWFRLDLEEADAVGEGEGEEPDALDRESLAADRARVVIARYGLVCRALLERELPALRWSEIFPALRRLELAGEVFAGRFFEGIEGPQFIGPDALRIFIDLDRAAPAGPLWINALDPAAAAAYAQTERLPILPARLSANRLCLVDGRVAAASTRSYRELVIDIDPGDAALPGALGVFRAARERGASPVSRVVLDNVNGESASRGPYAAALRDAGFEADRGRMVLW